MFYYPNSICFAANEIRHCTRLRFGKSAWSVIDFGALVPASALSTPLLSTKRVEDGKETFEKIHRVKTSPLIKLYHRGFRRTYFMTKIAIGVGTTAAGTCLRAGFSPKAVVKMSVLVTLS